MQIIRKPGTDLPVINTNNGVTFLTYPMFSGYNEIIHGISTRLGGVSQGIYSSMNLSFSRGDDATNVHENFNLFCNALGIDKNCLVLSDQTHTTNVRVITEADRGDGITRPKSFFETDGMITNVPQIALFTQYADCVPLMFFDPVKKAIGLSHSGWKGTVGKIGAVTVSKMTEEYGCNPKDILAAIGPSICQDCYEVSSDVALQFIEQFGDISDKIAVPQDIYFKSHNIQKDPVEGKYQLNLWEANKQIMLDAGILPEHISIPNLCTCCNKDFLFSHRASQGKRGNIGVVLMIK